MQRINLGKHPHLPVEPKLTGILSKETGVFSKRFDQAKKALLIMKLMIVMILAGSLQLSAKGYAQAITLSVKNESLEAVFLKIENQTDYSFVYEQGIFKSAKKVNLQVNGQSIEKVLELLFQNQPLAYKFDSKLIIVREKKPQTTIEVSQENAPPYIDVKGRVLNEKGEPVPGVTVTVKGSTKATSTNNNGEFALTTIDPSATLIFTSVSMESFELNVKGKTELVINLKTKVAELGDVMVTVSTGYQDIPKERATGSFVKINNELLNRSVSTNILDRIKDVSSGTLFNSSSNIIIRGISTIFANKQPLIVIDNFPYEGDINNINPNDVESITILRDAAAASIWGAKSGNGVIVISTKKGKTNTLPVISFNSNYTIEQKPDLFQIPNLSSSDYIDVENYLFGKGAFDGNGRFTSSSRLPLTPFLEIALKKRAGTITVQDSAKEISLLKQYDIRRDLSDYYYQQAKFQQYSLNVSGGNERQRYYFSLGYDRGATSQVGSKFNRITFTGNNDYELIPKKLTLNTGFIYTQKIIENNFSTPRFGSYAIYPYARISDENGAALPIDMYRKGYLDTVGNGKLLDWSYKPLDELTYSNNKSNLIDYRINLGLDYKATKSITVSLKYQYGKGVTELKNLRPQQTFYTRDLINRYSIITWSNGTVTRPVPLGAIYDLTNSNYNSHNARLQINYYKNWNDLHELSIIAGAQIQDINTESFTNRLYGYDDEHATNLQVDFSNNYRNYVTGISSKIENGETVRNLADRFVSYYGNMGYTYKGRYTFSGSFRKDASNLFGVESNQKVVPLWSIGGGWDIAKEPFFKSNLFPRLKIRTTYGYNANVDRSVTAFLVALIIPNNRYGAVQSQINNPPNPELGWEKTSMINFGIDYGLKNNRISGSIEYYRKKGIDLMGYAPLAPSTGLTSFKGNTANMKGEGIDIVINTVNINGQFSWLTTYLFSLAKDWVTSYKVQSTSIYTYITGTSLNPLVGKPVSSLFSYKWAGLDPATGDPQGLLTKLVSKDYSKFISSTDFDDMEFSGRSTPPIFGALRNTFAWKGIELSFNISYKFGYVFRRPSINYSDLFSSNNVGHLDFANRWKTAGDENHTNVPSMVYPAITNRDNFYNYSSILVEKGDHIRLQDIQLSYYIDKRTFAKIPVKGIKFYFYANNLGIIWRANDHNIDPDNILYPGIYSIAPLSKSFSAGLKLDF